jgi:hypothetical protein
MDFPKISRVGIVVAGIALFANAATSLSRIESLSAKSISFREVQTYSASAADNEVMIINIVDLDSSSFSPKVTVRGTSGEYLTYNTSANIASVSIAATAAGQYTFEVSHSDTSQEGHGSYGLYFLRVPCDNDGKSLINGGSISESIESGDLDPYSVEAKKGQYLIMNVVKKPGSTLVPRLYVYGPSGDYKTYNVGTDVAQIYFPVPEDGKYTLVVCDGSGALTGTGEYDFYFVQTPGTYNEKNLAIGYEITESIVEGELDSYTIEALKGQYLIMDVVKEPGSTLIPRVHVYGPEGDYKTYNVGADVAQVYFQVPDDGKYTLVVSDGSSSHTGTGVYRFYCVQTPGIDEEKLPVNGGSITASIDVGDLDSYIAFAKKGQNLILRLAKKSGTLIPRVHVYGPSGDYKTYNVGGNIAQVFFAVPEDGKYTFVVSDGGASHIGTGDYELFFIQTPGETEKSNPLSGRSVSEAIDFGDLDSYRFDATKGENLILSVVKEAGSTLVPLVYVYGPSGDYKTYNVGGDVAQVRYTVAEDGSYTVVICDGSANHEGTGNYRFHYVRTPSQDEGVRLTFGGTTKESIYRGDLDTYSVQAYEGDVLLITMSKLDTLSLIPRLHIYAPDGAYSTYFQGSSDTPRSFTVPVTGFYSFVVSDGNANYAGNGLYRLSLQKKDGPDPIIVDIKQSIKAIVSMWTDTVGNLEEPDVLIGGVGKDVLKGGPGEDETTIWLRKYRSDQCNHILIKAGKYIPTNIDKIVSAKSRNQIFVFINEIIEQGVYDKALVLLSMETKTVTAGFESAINGSSNLDCAGLKPKVFPKKSSNTEIEDSLDYQQVVFPSDTLITMKFSELFGEGFAVIDTSFVLLGKGLDRTLLLLETFNLMLRAHVAGDSMAYALQKNYAEFMLSEQEKFLDQSSGLFTAIAESKDSSMAGMRENALYLADMARHLKFSSALASKLDPPTNASGQGPAMFGGRYYLRQSFRNGRGIVVENSGKTGSPQGSVLFRIDGSQFKGNP